MIAATSFEAHIPRLGSASIAGSATFRTLVGVATAAQALHFIIEMDGGEIDDNTSRVVAADGAGLDLADVAGWAHVAPMPWSLDAEEPARRTWIRTGASLLIALMIRRQDGLSPPEQLRRGLNLLGGVRADLEAGFGGADRFAGGTVSTSLDLQPAPTRWMRDYVATSLTIHWKHLP